MFHSRISRTAATAMVTLIIGAACSPAPPGTDAFCAEITELDQLDITLNGDAAQLDEAVQDFEGLAEVAPAEINPSVRVLADALADVSRAVRNVRGDAAEALDAAMGALAPMVDEVEQASATVESYIEQNCNLPLSDPDTTRSP
jgi:ABC-type transporter Mla subunit MlaD